PDHRAGQRRLNTYLNSSLLGEVTKESILALGVELRGSMVAGGVKQWIDSFTYTLMEGGTPLSDYDHDLDRLQAIFTRSGLTSLSRSEIATMRRFINCSNGPESPDTICI